MDEVSGEEGVYAATMYHIHGESKPQAFEVTVELCGEPHKLEIDTGATRTVLNEETYKFQVSSSSFKFIKQNCEDKKYDVSKQSYHGFSLVTVPPLVVRLEFPQQNYS